MNDDYLICGRSSREWVFRDKGDLVIYFHPQLGDVGCVIKQPYPCSENEQKNLVISSQLALEKLQSKSAGLLTTSDQDIELIALAIRIGAKEDRERGDMTAPWYPAANGRRYDGRRSKYPTPAADMNQQEAEREKFFGWLGQQTDPPPISS